MKSDTILAEQNHILPQGRKTTRKGGTHRGTLRRGSNTNAAVAVHHPPVSSTPLLVVAEEKRRLHRDTAPSPEGRSPDRVYVGQRRDRCKVVTELTDRDWKLTCLESDDCLYEKYKRLVIDPVPSCHTREVDISDEEQWTCCQCGGVVNRRPFRTRFVFHSEEINIDERYVTMWKENDEKMELGMQCSHAVCKRCRPYTFPTIPLYDPDLGDWTAAPGTGGDDGRQVGGPWAELFPRVDELSIVL